MNIALTSPSSASETIVTLTRKGQVTIPVTIRRLLGLGTNRKVALVIDEQDNSVRLRVPRYPNVASLVGAAGSLNKKLQWRELLDIARADALSKSLPKGDE